MNGLSVSTLWQDTPSPAFSAIPWTLRKLCCGTAINLVSPLRARRSARLKRLLYEGPLARRDKTPSPVRRECSLVRPALSADVPRITAIFLDVAVEAPRDAAPEQAQLERILEAAAHCES